MSVSLKKLSFIVIPVFLLSSCSAFYKESVKPLPTPLPAKTPFIFNGPSPIPSPELKTPAPVPSAIPSYTTEPHPPPTSPKQTNPVPKSPIPSPVSNPVKISEERKDWYYMKKENNGTPSIDSEAKVWLPKYQGFYVYNTSQKVIYLTFDEGYENGFTPSILDTLKKQNVKASFFVTKPYITGNPELIKRMASEGHIIGNHTASHRAMNELSEEEINKELSGVNLEFKKVLGKDIDKFMRPPMGAYSEKSLYLTSKSGYKTIFWSMAYKDWDTENQPTREQTMSFIKTGHHNGAIILLHAVSKTNTECLDEIINYFKNQGYKFDTLVALNK